MNKAVSFVTLTIEDAFCIGILITSFDGVKVTGNKITSTTTAPISVSNSRNVTINGNKFTPPSTITKSGAPCPQVIIGGGNETGNIIVENK
ncbi:hypothetical protein [Geminisphaera colitermitum]|uniref:hypothetical protein n=1 Tax=Geminisphaera colitermitum TaxID=1148786 RepID=UPI000158C54C|nr:hypothetical protein [Geminisphaera colitermitum]